LLTADLVRARRRGGELKLQRFDEGSRARAELLARTYLDAARRLVGRTRGDLQEALGSIPHENRDRRLAAGLRKLVEDRCAFEADETMDARALRREVFERAAVARRALIAGAWFDREAVLAEVAALRGMPPGSVEALLFADLPERHVLRAVEAGRPEALVDGYPAAEAQAVLLRATRVTARVRCAAAEGYRALFRKLKFRRLLHRVQPLAEGGYQVDIDGPMSLFSSVTRYGLQLALILPAIQACDEWAVEGRVLWGRAREPLRFEVQGRARPIGGDEPPRLPDEVASLVERFEAIDSGWSVRPAAEVLELPGVGVCVPDLRFEHRTGGRVAYLEVLGFWSREAVWRRVELVQAGLPYRILFAVPKRLRVSEEVLDDDLPGQLLVYSASIAPKVVAARLDALL
jgi:predicted nuclease of restriction endonuclease-like RecB superfamily